MAAPPFDGVARVSGAAPGTARPGGIRYLQAFVTHWRLVLLLVVLAVAGAAAYSYLTPKKYQASADILVTPLDPNNTVFQGFSLFRQPQDGSSSVVTAARVLQSRQYRSAAFARLGNAGSGVSFTVTPLSQADVVTIQATAPSASAAALAANAYADAVIRTRAALFQSELRTRIGQLDHQIAAYPAGQRNGNFAYATLEQDVGQLKSSAGLGDPTLQILNRAVAPTAASWPRPKLSIAVAFVVALLVGGAFAVLLEVANPRVAREDELVLEERLPILTRIPRLPNRVAHGYLMGTASLPAEAWRGYRTLRAVLSTAGPRRSRPKSVLLTSANPGDGKTMTAVNLAITLALSDLRVVLVDGDVHRPMVGNVFDVKVRRDGFLRVLKGEATVADAIVPAPSHQNLQLLLSNREQVQRLNTLEGRRFPEVLKELEQLCDVVVIDSPPIPEVAEALSLVAAVDVVLIAARLGHTRWDRLAELRDLLARRGVTPLGFVVTTRDRPSSQYSDYDYGYAPSVPDGAAGSDVRELPLRESGNGWQRRHLRR